MKGETSETKWKDTGNIFEKHKNKCFCKKVIIL